MRKKKVISGSGSTLRIRGAPEPSREIFVYRIHPDTTEDEFKEYMEYVGITVRAIECTSKVESHFKSYHVTIPVSHLERAFTPAAWPEGVRVRKFWPKKQQTDSER